MRRLWTFALWLFAASGSACALLIDTEELAGEAKRASEARDAQATLDSQQVGDARIPDDSASVADQTQGEGPCPARPSDPSLVAWYPFEENDPSVILDCAGQLDGTLEAGGSFARAPGRIGQGLDLNGNACFDLGLAPQLAFGAADFTVAAWIKPRTFAVPDPDGGSNPKPIWVFSHFGASLGTGRGWGIGTDDPAAVEFKFFDQSGGLPEAESTVSTGQWVHIAGVFTTGSIRLYLYGSPQVTTPVGTSPGVDPEGHGFLGCRALDQPRFDGMVDDVRVYSRVLGDEEIAALAAPP